MLNTLFISFNFKKHIKTGFYIDYFLRIIAQRNVRNIFIWGALYVAEKFLIEYTTRFTSNNYMTSFQGINTPLNVFSLTLKWLAMIALVMFL